MQENQEIIEIDEKEKLYIDRVKLISTSIIELINKLPYEVVSKRTSTPTKIDESVKPLVEEMTQKFIAEGVSLAEVNDAIELIGFATSYSLKRVMNWLSESLSYVYYNKIGYFNPEEEMTFTDIMNNVKEVNDKQAELSTDSTE